MEVFVKIARQIAQKVDGEFGCFGHLYKNYFTLLTEKNTDAIISYSYHIRRAACSVLDVHYASKAGRVADAFNPPQARRCVLNKPQIYLRRKNMKKFLICLIAMALVFCMVLPLTSCVTPAPEENESSSESESETDPKPDDGDKDPEQSGSNESGDSEDPTEETTTEFVPYVDLATGTGYTWKDAVVTLASNWNQHTYQTSDDSYPISFITTGLYGFFFNDEEIYKSTNNADPFAGYVIAPEMAAEMPVDVTETIKALEGNPYNIPESATKGYAYVIKLNPNAKWQNGEAINADTYVYSMKQLLDPVLMNYRATDYFDGSLAIANARNYYYQGKTSYLANSDELGLADLQKGEDGVYFNPATGNKMYIAIDVKIAYFSGKNSLADYVGAYGDKYFSMTHWEALNALKNDDGVVALTDETYPMIKDVITGNAAWGEDETYMHNYFVEGKYFEADYSFDNVGLYKSGDYEITLVLEKSLTDFNLLYNLSGNWIVYESIYEASKKEIGETGVITSEYCSSVETTMSYGPYVMTEYQSGKYMKFAKNENWFGYTDGKHVYVDPENGETYNMYQTTNVVCQVVSEASTRKLMFLKGELMGYGLQSSDFDEYRSSDRAYVTPSETIFFLIFNGHMDAIKEREAAEGFDKATTDLETMTLNSFRRAFAVTYDKEAFASTISPSRSGGYGLIGTAYIYDPETGARYRDTDQAKKALCDFYSVDVSKFDSLDEAVDSITGYDPETAKELFTQAYNEAIDAGYITDANNDGKSDQTVKIEYCSSATSDFMKQTIGYLNDKLNEVLVGTPFEGKVEIYESAPYGNAWSDTLKAGMSDTVLAGWSGSALDPFGLTDLYTNPEYQYDAAWFNAASVDLELEIDGEKIKMNLKQWSDALNGTVVTIGDKEYNFGSGMTSVDNRLTILAAIETQVLSTYNYIPALQDGSVALLTKQVFYVVEDYNPIMGRGGIAYTRYNYNDDQWIAYIAEQGGQIKY